MCINFYFRNILYHYFYMHLFVFQLIFVFVVVNLKSKMLIIMNTKFRALHFFDFCHFSQILNHWLRRLKIREFWEVWNCAEPLLPLVFGHKKASTWDAILAETRNEISAKCKKLAPSSAPLEGCLGYPNPYFWHLFHVSWK